LKLGVATTGDKEYEAKKCSQHVGFTAELLQAAMRELAPLLKGLFNKMWSSGEFQIEWNEGPRPVFKKGDAESTNYRTIIIGPTLESRTRLW
jgi:hypothetical protein